MRNSDTDLSLDRHSKLARRSLEKDETKPQDNTSEEKLYILISLSLIDGAKRKSQMLPKFPRRHTSTLAH